MRRPLARPLILAALLLATLTVHGFALGSRPSPFVLLGALALLGLLPRTGSHAPVRAGPFWRGLFVVAGLAVAADNLRQFPALNTTVYRLRLREETSFAQVAQSGPSLSGRTTLRLYLFLRDALRGRELVTFSPAVFSPLHLRHVSGLPAPTVRRYAFALTPDAEEALTRRRHATLLHKGNTLFYFVYPAATAAPDAPVYVLVGATGYFLVPEDALPSAAS